MSSHAKSANEAPIHVLIATPLGEHGNGGIDRLMDLVRNEYAKGGQDEVVIRFGTTRGKGHILFSPVYLGLFLLKMALLKARGHLDLLHINLSSQGSFSRKRIVAAWARMLRVPYTLHLHGSRFREFFEGASASRKEAIRKTFVHAASAMVLGNYWRDFVAGIDGRINTVILHNATAPIPLAPGSSEGAGVHIAFLGALGPRKGTPELVRAASVIADVADWKMTIAGNGEVDETREEVSELGLENRIEIPGWLGPADSVALLAGCDIVVLPSYNENLPMSVIEGMGAGKAVVTTPVGAVPDIMTDGVNGLLVQPGDVDGLANALRRLVEDAELRSALGRNARSTHQEMLDIRTYLPRLVHLWKAALEGAPDRDLA